MLESTDPQKDNNIQAAAEPWQQEGEMLLPVEEWVEGAVATLSVQDCVCVFTLHSHVSLFSYAACGLLGHRSLKLLTLVAFGGSH